MPAVNADAPDGHDVDRVEVELVGKLNAFRSRPRIFFARPPDWSN